MKRPSRLSSFERRCLTQSRRLPRRWSYFSIKRMIIILWNIGESKSRSWGKRKRSKSLILAFRRLSARSLSFLKSVSRDKAISKGWLHKLSCMRSIETIERRKRWYFRIESRIKRSNGGIKEFTWAIFRRWWAEKEINSIRICRRFIWSPRGWQGRLLILLLKGKEMAQRQRLRKVCSGHIRMCMASK